MIPTAWICKSNPVDQTHLLEYSDLILAMLRDDHYLVREHATRRVMQLTQSNHSGKTLVLPISSRTEEIYLDWLYNQIHTLDLTSKTKFWHSLFERQLDLEIDATDAMEVFTKNEANLFGERLHTARLVYQKLTKLPLETIGFPVPLSFKTDYLFFTEDCIV